MEDTVEDVTRRESRSGSEEKEKYIKRLRPFQPKLKTPKPDISGEILEYLGEGV